MLDNKPENCDKYGRLYDLSMVADICPKGWHLPTDSDWDVFINSNAAIGKKLKSKKGWSNFPKAAGTDAYDFSALPGGYQMNNKFRDIGKEGKWWEAGPNGNLLGLKYNSDKLSREAIGKAGSFSVRCLRD